LGAAVDLDKAPLKYEGLSYTEIWISESQERMVLAVPPENWPALHQLCTGEDVEATIVGEFEATRKLRLRYQGQQVAELDMRFLHDGRPAIVRKATAPVPVSLTSPLPEFNGRSRGEGKATGTGLTDTLLRILSSPNVCSKEWIIRQYDHEVQGGSVVK